MSGTLRSCDYIFTVHGPCFSFGSASLSAAILNNYIVNKIKTTAAHKTSRLKSDQILCGRCGQLFCGNYKIIRKGTENEM